jgi:hypothetical protein
LIPRPSALGAPPGAFARRITGAPGPCVSPPSVPTDRPTDRPAGQPACLPIVVPTSYAYYYLPTISLIFSFDEGLRTDTCYFVFSLPQGEGVNSTWWTAG